MRRVLQSCTAACTPRSHAQLHQRLLTSQLSAADPGVCRRATTCMFEDLHSTLSMAAAEAAACSEFYLHQAKPAEQGCPSLATSPRPAAAAAAAAPPPAGLSLPEADGLYHHRQQQQQQLSSLTSLQPDEHGRYNIPVRQLLELSAGVTQAPCQRP